MWKSFFILLSSITFVFASLEEGDTNYNNFNYKKALEYYKKAYNENPQQKKLKQRLVATYIKLGDNFCNLTSCIKAEYYYRQAYDLGSKLGKKKLSILYEKKADLYKKGNRFKLAYETYLLAQEWGNENLDQKLKDMQKILDHQSSLLNDTRKIVTQNSPLWTKSIGRLIVPIQVNKEGKRISTKIEKCSATLVAFDESSSSQVIISASHCLSKFDGSAGVLRFIIKSQKGKLIQKYAKVFVKSDFDLKKIDKKSDYAVLSLSSPISKEDVPPLYVSAKSFYTLKNESNKSFASLGGFSSDIGEFGSNLSYDPKCELSRYNQFYAKSNCSGFKGASGGPVVLNVLEDKRFKSYFVGVVSHFKNNQYKNIFFAPHHIFYNDIKNAIEQNKL